MNRKFGDTAKNFWSKAAAWMEAVDWQKQRALHSGTAKRWQTARSRPFVPGWFRQPPFWRSKLIGMIDIRHRLNEGLLRFGGNIGYSVRPCCRRQGYATQMLALALEECRKMQMQKVLVTCNKENIGSAKTIQKNGGVLENEVAGKENGEDRITQRYWITL